MRATTIATWRNALGNATDGEHDYTHTHHQLGLFAALPTHRPHHLELARAADPADRSDVDALVEQQWHVVDAAAVASDPWQYAEYVRRSDAEWSVAQGIYVELETGWVSDRTAAYLASGRPAIVQDTGLDGALPLGKGLCPFVTAADAIEALDSVAADYEAHSHAARELAEQHFASDRVLARFLEQCGL
jgi:hypothetical protein